jgi:hypothetical protein
VEDERERWRSAHCRAISETLGRFSCGDELMPCVAMLPIDGNVCYGQYSTSMSSIVHCEVYCADIRVDYSQDAREVLARAKPPSEIYG